MALKDEFPPSGNFAYEWSIAAEAGDFRAQESLTSSQRGAIIRTQASSVEFLPNLQSDGSFPFTVKAIKVVGGQDVVFDMKEGEMTVRVNPRQWN